DRLIITRAAAAARTRTQRPGKHLAVHASELVVKPDFQILRRYRRPLLLRLEHTHRPTLEDYVHRATRLGSSRSLNLRIGIRRRAELATALAAAHSLAPCPNMACSSRYVTTPCGLPSGRVPLGADWTEISKFFLDGVGRNSCLISIAWKGDSMLSHAYEPLISTRKPLRLLEYWP